MVLRRATMYNQQSVNQTKKTYPTPAQDDIATQRSFCTFHDIMRIIALTTTASGLVARGRLLLVLGLDRMHLGHDGFQDGLGLALLGVKLVLLHVGVVLDPLQGLLARRLQLLAILLGQLLHQSIVLGHVEDLGGNGQWHEKIFIVNFVTHV